MRKSSKKSSSALLPFNSQKRKKGMASITQIISQRDKSKSKKTISKFQLSPTSKKAEEQPSLILRHSHDTAGLVKAKTNSRISKTFYTRPKRQRANVGSPSLLTL